MSSFCAFILKGIFNYHIGLNAGAKKKKKNDIFTFKLEGSYLVLVLYQITEYVIWIEDSPVTVLNVVSPHQKIAFL